MASNSVAILFFFYHHLLFLVVAMMRIGFQFSFPIVSYSFFVVVHTHGLLESRQYNRHCFFRLCAVECFVSSIYIRPTVYYLLSWAVVQFFTKSSQLPSRIEQYRKEHRDFILRYIIDEAFILSLSVVVALGRCNT